VNDPTPLLTAKFYLPPPRPNRVARTRLLKRIQAGFEGKLILISAPAGYGKTTLVSELVGQVNQQIAQALHLSLYTVKSHARNIYSKLGVKNRTEAVARARLLGLLKV